MIDSMTRRARTPLSTPGRVAATVGVGVAVDVAFDPTHTHVPLCPFHAMTGWSCPLCGGLRAVYELAHGDLRAAVHDNILVVAALPVLAVAWLMWVGRQRDERAARPVPRLAVVGAIAIAVVFTVVRNLPIGSAVLAR